MSGVVMPGYKQTEVGVIPEDWNVTTAAQVCELVVDCKNRTPPVIDGGEFAVVRTPNVRSGKFVRDELRFTDEQSFDEWTARAVPQIGDVLITREAPLGEVCLVPPDVKVCLGQRMMLYRPDPKKADSRFLLYSLMSPGVQTNLLKKIGGSIVGHAKVDDIRYLQVPQPPTKLEQQRIAEALSDVDALIEGLGQLISKKLEVKQGAMQDLLSGRKRLSQERVNTFKNSEIGEIPSDWHVTEVGNIANVKTGPFGSSLHEHDYVEDGTPIITVEHLGKRGITYSNLPKVSEKDLKRLSAYSLQEGDIVFSRVGSIDRNAFVSKAEQGWLFSGRLLRVRRLSSKIDTEYLSYHFRSEPFKNRVRTVAVGQTMASLNTQILKSVYVVLPPYAEQVAIATILSDMDAEIAGLEVKLDKARRLKEGMMQDLLTGKVRLV